MLDKNLHSAAERLVVALAQSGDRDAFAELVNRHQSRLRNLARRLCGDATLADDLVQQTFLQAWRGIAKLRSTAAFNSWLKRLTINTWLQHSRGNEPLNNTKSKNITEQENNAFDTLDPDIYKVHNEKESVNQTIDLDRALAQLQPKVRLCVVLAYDQGFSHSAISELTGLPLGTVKSHIIRGSARLRNFLHAYAERSATVDSEHSHAQ